MTETWSWIELIWTVANVLGVLGNGRLVKLAYEKRSAVLQLGGRTNGPRYAAGTRHIRNDLGRLACHLIGVAIGIYAMLTVEPDPILDLLSAWGLVTIMAVLMGLSVFDLLDERRLDRMLSREQELEGSDG